MAEGPGPRFPSQSPKSSLGAAEAPAEFEPVDIDDIVEDRTEDRLSVEELMGGDIEFDDGPVTLLSLTGENWSIDAQRETLKEAARDNDRSAAKQPEAPSVKPALALPTPFDFGASSTDEHTALLLEEDDAVDEPSPPPARAPMRTIPPPLPSGGSGAPPARTGPPPPVSVRPPPPAATPSRRPPPPGAKSEVPPPAPPSRAPSGPTIANETPRVAAEGRQLVDLLTARIDRLASGDDRVGLARAHVELAIVQETLGDDGQVTAAIEAALKVAPDLAAAHSILRRRIHHPTRLAAMLQHLDREIEVASSDTDVVELICERARLLVASHRSDDARKAWEQVLARVPNHAAALKGLETDLARRTFIAPEGGGADVPTADEGRWDELVVHLGRMADAYTGQADLAAWLHVERARIFEFRLGRIDAARGAYEHAIKLDDRVGPVRDAFTLHCAAHNDLARLATLLGDEAKLETDGVRSARLELDAAAIVDALGGDDPQTVALLERAAARAPTTPDVDRRVLDELVRLYEVGSRWAEAARSRRTRLRFFSDAASLVYELKRLSMVEERLGNVHTAIRDVERAAEIAPEDGTLASDLDRLLSLVDDDEGRMHLWHDRAQHEEDGTKRARLLAKAAQIAEGIGRHDEAVRHLRAAWVSAPGDSELLDQLSRLISPSPPSGLEHDVRGLIELYAQAAQSTRDDGRRIACLEKVAMLWEEIVGDQVRAARTFEEILRLEPGRRGAVLGLQRTAGRIGDHRALSRALADEAKLADDGATVLALRVRSAQVLASVDAARASSIVAEVLEQDPEHIGARALETRLHEDAGRWELAAKSLQTRLSIALTTKEKVELWLHLARIFDARLRDPKAAVEALQAARKADPVHPVPPEEIARVLGTAGDAKALRFAVEQLADDAITPQERARHLIFAAEIDELRLNDPDSAAALYARALAETPESELSAERLVRVLARRAAMAGAGPAVFGTPAWAELATQLGKRAAAASSKQRAKAFSLLSASLLVAENRELPQARALLDTVPGDGVAPPGVLRLREVIARRISPATHVAAILKEQGETFTDICARLGALWELTALEAWKLPHGEVVGTYTRILELDSTDPSALAAAVRLAIGPARRGDVPARRATISALRSLSALAHDEGTKLATLLRLGLILEVHALDPAAERETIAAASREALERLRETLTLDPLSVAAATSLARVANRLGDTAAAVAAATSLAELAVQPKVRARYLLDAANLILSEADDAATEERSQRAAAFLEKALAADANSKAAASRLVQVRTRLKQSERLVDVFRSALAEATARDTVVFVGTELARVAQEELGDIGVAIDAMRAVRKAAPDHVPSLLTLSELFIAQDAWNEAIEVLQEVARRGREPAPRVTALFALASIYDKVLLQPEDAERALRTALGIQPDNPRAIRALVHRLAAKQNDLAAGTHLQANVAARMEIASLLDRLTHAEKDRSVKCDVLLELADIRVSLEDMPQAEKALVEAVAVAPDHARAFARLSRFFRSPALGDAPAGFDVAGYARALDAVIARGKALGTADPRWHATLGRIEVEQLNRLHEGIGHLRAALELDPSLHACRYELASAYVQLGAHEEATKAALALIVPDAATLGALADANAGLELIERALTASRQVEEAIVISELRAVAGTLDEGRHAWLRARRLSPLEQHHTALDRATLVSQAVPPDGRKVLLDIAGAISGVESRILRPDISEIGISSRDRIGRRSGHPTRALLDRLTKALGISDVELVVTSNVARTRVIAQDDPWIVVPKSLTELPEPTQAAALGRALARIALSVPWLEEIPPGHIEAMLLAAGRLVNAGYGSDKVDALTLKLVGQYEAMIARELSRKQRQALERLVPAMNASAGTPASIDGLIYALARAELRIAYVLTGDVLATVDELRGLDGAFLQATASAGRKSVLAVLHHPFAGDVVRFALTPESTALRRRVGSTWAG